MAKLITYWNFVNVPSVDASPAQLYRGNVNANPAKFKTVPKGCKGVYFRSVLREDIDFNAFLDNAQLDQLRQERKEPDNSLLHRGKPDEQKSIGTLRIIRPKRLTTLSRTDVGQAATAASSLVGSSPLAAGLSVASARTRVSEFDVLLESTEFILEDVQEQMAEKFQLQETFGNFNVFFFGKRAEIFTYSGSLFNSDTTLSWKNQFLRNYDEFLRGTKSAEMQARAYLLYDDVIREGFILSAGINQNSSFDTVVKFNFTLLVTGKKILSPVPEARQGTIVLGATAPDNEFGINEFQFIRTPSGVGERIVDDNLPGATTEPAIADQYPFVRDDSMPDTQIPPDLENLLRTRALDAVEKLSSAGGFNVGRQEGASLDHDVILDFIPASDLPSGTRNTVAGGKSQDADNLSGEVIVSRLVSGDLAADDLKLRDAFKAADELIVRGNPETGESEISESTTKDLQNFRAALSDNNRISKDEDNITLSRADDVRGEQKFFLSERHDSSPINQVIVDFSPIDEQAQNISLLTDDAITNSTFRVFDLIRTSKTYGFLNSILAYFATFVYVKGPDGQLLPFMKDSAGFFSGVAEATGNALDFMRGQLVTSFADSNGVAQGEVLDAFDQSSDALLESPLAKLIATELDIGIAAVRVSEGLLFSSTKDQPPGAVGTLMSQTAADSLNAFLVYITGIIHETSEASGKPVSADITGGTVAPVSNDMLPSYFTQEYADSTSPTNSVTNAEELIIFRGNIGNRFIKDNLGRDFLALPLTFYSETTSISVMSLSDLQEVVRGTGVPLSTVVGGVFGPIGSLIADFILSGGTGVTIKAPTIGTDLFFLRKSGYIFVSEEEKDEIQSIISGASDAVVIYRGKKRETDQNLATVAKVTAGIDVGLQNPLPVTDFKFDGKNFRSSIQISAYPQQRSYFSTRSTKEYDEPSMITARNSLVQANSRVSELIDDAIPEAVDKVIEVVNSGQFGEDPDAIRAAEEELDIDNFTDSEKDTFIPGVKTANDVLIDMGGTPESYLAFTSLLGTQNVMLFNLIGLRDSIGSAVNAIGNSSDVAASVKESDDRLRQAQCRIET